jgi:electron transport complex protein RnfB
VEICPTECLQLHPVKVTLRNWRWPAPEAELAGA